VSCRVCEKWIEGRDQQSDIEVGEASKAAERASEVDEGDKQRGGQ